jgi:hypothetical protein
MFFSVLFPSNSSQTAQEYILSLHFLISHLLLPQMVFTHTPLQKQLKNYQEPVHCQHHRAFFQPCLLNLLVSFDPLTIPFCLNTFSLAPQCPNTTSFWFSPYLPKYCFSVSLPVVLLPINVRVSGRLSPGSYFSCYTLSFPTKESHLVF